MTGLPFRSICWEMTQTMLWGWVAMRVAEKQVKKWYASSRLANRRKVKYGKQLLLSSETYSQDSMENADLSS